MAQNNHLIEVKLLATSMKDAKLKFSSLLFDNDSFLIPISPKNGTIAEQALNIFKAANFKIAGYGVNKTLRHYIFMSPTFEPIKPIKNSISTLGENPFKSLKTTAQKPTNQKPTKKYKRCI